MAERQRLLFERVEKTWQLRRDEVDKSDTKVAFLLTPLGLVVGVVVDNVAHIPQPVRERFYWGVGALVIALLLVLIAAMPRRWSFLGDPERLLSDPYRSMAESSLWGRWAKTLGLAVTENERRLKWKHRAVRGAFLFLAIGIVALVAAYMSVAAI